MITTIRYTALAIFSLLLTTSSWGAVDQAARGQEEYDRTMAAAAKACDEGQNARRVSHLYLRGAGHCRDLGANGYAIELFNAAVAADPDYAQARRLYGDYLMGYRGLYEFAAEQYYAALEIVRRLPDEHDEAFRRLLDRSLQILHRDGRDGIPVYTSSSLSLFVDGAAGYRRDRPNTVPVGAGDGSLLGQQLKLESFIDNVRQPELEAGATSLQQSIRANDEGIGFFNRAVAENNDGLEFFGDKLASNVEGISFFSQMLADSPGAPDAPAWQAAIDALASEASVNAARVDEINDDKAANQKMISTIQEDRAANEDRLQGTEEELTTAKQRRARAAHYAERRTEDLHWQAGVLLRFGNTALPYVRFDWGQVDGERADINVENLDHPLNRKFDRYALTLGKHYMLPRNVDLRLKGAVAMTDLKFYDPFNRVRLSREESTQYDVQSLFSKNMGLNTLRLAVGGGVADIENDTSQDDSSWRGNISLRLSHFPPEGKAQTTDRFKGRRSTHVESGLTYSERDFKSPSAPTTTESVYRPFISYEELALVRGWLDLFAMYDWRQQDISNGNTAGTYSSHNFTLVPTLVPVYRLYDNKFWTGIEHATLGFPVSVSLGDGDFDRYTVGVQAMVRYVTPYGVTVTPVLSGDYTYYSEISEDDWGVYLKVVLSSGARREVPHGGRPGGAS